MSESLFLVMVRISVIATLFVAIFCISGTWLVHGQITEAESKARKVLVKSLQDSPKISRILKNKFLRNDETFEEERVNIIIQFTSKNSKMIEKFKADLKSGVIKNTATRGERISNLVERLEDNAALSQKEVISFLESQNCEFKALWLENEIYVKGASARLVTEISQKFRKVGVVRQVGLVGIPKLIESTSTDFSRAGADPPTLEANGAPWWVNQAGARCTSINCKGEGVVIAFLDTGVMIGHEELKGNYRTPFGYYDPIVNVTDPTQPVLEGFHGSFCAGIAVGRKYGVAPNAKWIACRIFRINFDEEVYIKACGEWALCPFELVNGTKQKDCSKAPNIINNSWTDIFYEEFEHPYDFFYATILAWTAAGILHTFSAGNNGPYCSTIGPPSSYDIAFTIGNVDNTSTIFYQSSRGPVLNLPPSSNSSAGVSCQTYCKSDQSVLTSVTGSNQGVSVCTLIKPDISAPGTLITGPNIITSSSYLTASGTSASAPIISGIFAIVLCANYSTPDPNQTIQKLDDVKYYMDLLRKTANRDNINLLNGTNVTDQTNYARNSHLLCDLAFGNICGFPNNVYGYGAVNACRAVEQIMPGSIKPITTTMRPTQKNLGQMEKLVVPVETKIRVESEGTGRGNLIKSLNSPKISSNLRNKFLQNNQRNLEKKRVQIMIEFNGGNAKALKEFKDDSSSGVIKATETREERISRLVETLEKNSASSQTQVIALLQDRKLDYQSLWATNEIFVDDADAQLVADIAEKCGGNVEIIRPLAKMEDSEPRAHKTAENFQPDFQRADGIPWQKEKIKVTGCKNITCFGEGIVVAFLDNGILYNHKELKDNYRNDNFSWYDPILMQRFPSLDNGTSPEKGTAVAAAAVGKNIGIAPKATWIACRATGTNSSEMTAKMCGMWALCPWLWNDVNVKNCSAAPHIINCSWGYTPSSLLTTAENFYYDIVAMWNAAGIVSTWMAGDEGPYCTTLRAPAYYDISFSVGSIDERSNIQINSSRGPALNLTHMGQPDPITGLLGLCDGGCQDYCKSSSIIDVLLGPLEITGGSTRVCTLNKPDITAPGVNIFSANVTNTSDYGYFTSTAYSTPIVTGVIALILCANNKTNGQPMNVSTIQNIIKQTANTTGINLVDGNDISDNGLVLTLHIISKGATVF